MGASLAKEHVSQECSLESHLMKWVAAITVFLFTHTLSVSNSLFLLMNSYLADPTLPSGCENGGEIFDPVGITDRYSVADFNDDDTVELKVGVLKDVSDGFDSD